MLVGECESITYKLSKEQGHYRTTLINDVREFAADVKSFRADYLANGGHRMHEPDGSLRWFTAFQNAAKLLGADCTRRTGPAYRIFK